jgi:glycosyltransferase involved in cell wall biosynthesis
VSTLSVLVRFRDDADTLPAVLAALRAQDRPFDELVGVDTGCRDASADLVRAAGGRVIAWNGRYDPGAVLNAGISACRGDLVMLCSSHSVLEDPTILAALEACFDDPCVSAASLAWDGRGEPGERVDAEALRRAGLRPGSYYSNSMGMLRRSVWERRPFATGWPRAAEDFRWAVEEILDGGVVRRVRRPYRWLRESKPWAESYRVAWLTFQVARQHGLPLRWKGMRRSARALLHALARFAGSLGRDARARRDLIVHSARIAARVQVGALGSRDRTSIAMPERREGQRRVGVS